MIGFSSLNFNLDQMNKIIFFFFLLASGLHLDAQTIEYSKNSLSAFITPEGILKGTTGVAAGYILPNGTIKNALHVTIGSIGNNGEIKNASDIIKGYVSPEGVVKNELQDVVGYVKVDGSVQNELGNKIGNAPGVPNTWAAICYFFYKVN